MTTAAAKDISEALAGLGPNERRTKLLKGLEQAERVAVAPPSPTVINGTPKPEHSDGSASETSMSIAVDAYYESPTKEYFLRNARGAWLPFSESQFKRHLRAQGYSTSPGKDELLSPADRVILEIQNHRDIQYAGRLCGRRIGFYEENGTRFLVTSSFETPTPNPGRWGTIEAIVEGLLTCNEPDHGRVQASIFHGWMASAVTALRAERIQAAQALAVAGPAGCGKSLLQSLISAMLGGRAAKAARYMQGATPFNGDLFEAEHLMLEDEFMSSKISERLKLAASIKNATVSTRVQSCHRKNRQAVSLPAWWRVSITLNDDAEALMVLPPLDEHVADKIILLRASRFDFPMPMGTSEEQEAAWRQIEAEVPAYTHWLLNDFNLPEELTDPRRYGVATWHHPTLRAQLESLSPESSLLDMIDQIKPWGADLWWEGPASDLQEKLFADARTMIRARQLLDWTRACGTYLGRLARKMPERVEEARKEHQRGYRVKPPPETE